jgi:hypothetical protein
MCSFSVPGTSISIICDRARTYMFSPSSQGSMKTSPTRYQGTSVTNYQPVEQIRKVKLSGMPRCKRLFYD